MDFIHFLKGCLWTLININIKIPCITHQLIELSDTLLKQLLYCSPTGSNIQKCKVRLLCFSAMLSFQAAVLMSASYFILNLLLLLFNL